MTNIEKEIEIATELRNSYISSVVTGQLDVHSIEVPKYEYFDEKTGDEESGVIDSEEVLTDEQ